jgi:hypothetical protein
MTIHSHHPIRRAALAPLAILAIAAPAASAMPADGPINAPHTAVGPSTHAPIDAPHHAVGPNRHLDLRSPDAKDAARIGHEAPNPGPPTWSSHSAPVHRSAPVTTTDGGGIDLPPAGVLIAAGSLALAACGVGGAVRLRTRATRSHAAA